MIALTANWHVLLLWWKMDYSSLAQKQLFTTPLALQADVLHIPRSYFRNINSSKEIRCVLCHVCLLAAQAPQLQCCKSLKASDILKIKRHLSRKNTNYSNSLSCYCSSLPTSAFLLIRPFFPSFPLCLNLRMSLCFITGRNISSQKCLWVADNDA